MQPKSLSTQNHFAGHTGRIIYGLTQRKQLDNSANYQAWVNSVKKKEKRTITETHNVMIIWTTILHVYCRAKKIKSLKLTNS